MLRPVVHLLLHLLVPALVAGLFFRREFLKSWMIMTATMLVDVDHFLAEPVYDPGRCSIGFHPLHGYSAIAVYAVVTAWPRLRLLGIGLLIHMALDGVDCWWMGNEN